MKLSEHTFNKLNQNTNINNQMDILNLIDKYNNSLLMVKGSNSTA